MGRTLVIVVLQLTVASAVCSAQYKLYNVREFTTDSNGCNTNFPRLPFGENTFAMWGGQLNDSNEVIEQFTYADGIWSAKPIGNGNLRVPARYISNCVSDTVLWGAHEDSIYFTTDYDRWTSIGISDSGRSTDISDIQTCANGSAVISLYHYVVDKEYYSGGTRIRITSDGRSRIIIASADTVVRLYESSNTTGRMKCIPNADASQFVLAKSFHGSNAMLLILDRSGIIDSVCLTVPSKLGYYPNHIVRDSTGDFWVVYSCYDSRDSSGLPFILRYDPIGKTQSVIEFNSIIGATYADGEFVYMADLFGFFVFCRDRSVHYNMLDLVPEIKWNMSPYGFTSINPDTMAILIGGIYIAHIPKSVLYSQLTSVEEEHHTGIAIQSDAIQIPLDAPNGASVNWSAYNDLGQLVASGTALSENGSVALPTRTFPLTRALNFVLSTPNKPAKTQRVYLD